MKFIRVFSFLIALFGVQYGFSEASTESSERLFILTVPKSGTHLLDKYFRLLREQGIHVGYSMSHLSTTHLGLPKNYFYDHPEVKKIIMVRDLRDVFCSLVNHLDDTSHWLHKPMVLSKNWHKRSFQQKLGQLIDYRRRPFSQDFTWDYHGKDLPLKQKEMIERAIEYMSLPNTLLVRFEELIGPQGGGSIEEQLEIIQKINDFVGIEVSDEQLDFTLDNLFGNKRMKTLTFKKGKSGEWPKHFNDFLNTLFKERYGQHLIEFGYETDLNW